MGYLGWMVYSAIFVMKQYAALDSSSGKRQSIETSMLTPTRISGMAVFIAASVFLWFKQAPLMYYLYVVFAVFFWAEVVHQRDTLTFQSFNARGLGSTVWHLATYILGLEILVCLTQSVSLISRYLVTFDVKFLASGLCFWGSYGHGRSHWRFGDSILMC
jgi:hypothetical protein